MSRWRPWSWGDSTDRHGAREWFAYAICRLIGHRVVAHADVGHVCERCRDTMPQGTDRWQP